MAGQLGYSIIGSSVNIVIEIPYEFSEQTEFTKMS